MESLYHETNRNLESAYECFVRLERSGGESSTAIEREILARIDQIVSNVERLEILVGKEAPHRRQFAKVRVQQLKADVQHLSSSVRSIQAKQWARDQRERDRNELLNMKFTTNSVSNASDTSILIDKALDHSNALQRSNRGVDDLIGQGQAMLGHLRDQRSMMKGVQKKMMDIASMLGMSNTVIRLIERRSEGDKYVLIGGMLITCFVMFIVIRYFI